MSVTIQEVALKGFSVAVSDDSLQRRISLEGSKGEMILLTCGIRGLIAMTGTFAKEALADLVWLGPEAGGALLQRRTAATEDDVAVRIKLVGEGAAQRDAVPQALA